MAYGFIAEVISICHCVVCIAWPCSLDLIQAFFF